MLTFMQYEFTWFVSYDLMRDHGGLKYVDLKNKIVFSNDTRKKFS